MIHFLSLRMLQYATYICITLTLQTKELGTVKKHKDAIVD